jgi:hypothetical protein
MAKAFAIKRATAQPVTIDTTTIGSTPLGGAIPGMQLTSLFPGRCTNLSTVFAGDPYLIVVSAVGNIEIYRYVSSAWALVGGPFTPAVGHVLKPLCLHLVNNTIAALWSDEAGAGDGISVSLSTNGTSWSSAYTQTASIGTSSGGHSIVYRGTIWFTTAIGLWCFAPLARFITLGGIVGAYQVGETVTGSSSGTTAVVRSFNSPILRVDTVVGTGFTVLDTITGGTSGATGTYVSNTRFVNAAPDQGNDTGLTGATGPSNLIGSFASWDGMLHFAQPKTASGPTKIYRLNQLWEATNNVPAPQWTSISFSGIVDAGFASVSDDSGMWSLFNNKADELSLFYSGSGSTKLAKTTSRSLPLVFTDVSNSVLPPSIATKTNLGITLYADDRRRANVLHNFFIKDYSGGALILATWDGASSLRETGSVGGTDFLLPVSRSGEELTFTNLQPTASITGVSYPFPGRVRIDYVVRSSPAHLVDVAPEYSLDGDQYFPMTEGDGDSGPVSLPASAIGDPYFFYWDAFADLDGDLSNVLLRVLARISGV